MLHSVTRIGRQRLNSVVITRSRGFANAVNKGKDQSASTTKTDPSKIRSGMIAFIADT